MKKIDFNKNWLCRRLEDKEGIAVNLPHDAMISEPRSEKSKGEGNIGWFEAGDYEYTKTFFVPEEYCDKKVLFEFEGVYHNAEVYLNGQKAAYRPYGYTNFYVETAGLLQYGKDNEIRVIARNADQPNSRWYSGTGIYRPVFLYVSDYAYIPVNGLRIQTVSCSPAAVEIEVNTSMEGNVELEVLDGEKVLAQTKVPSIKSGNMMQATAKLELPEAQLWNTDTPKLYTCRARFGTDEVQEQFGIRLLQWNSESGLTINGERVILRGACVHHDNGILGACSFPEAEERRVRILKENGYNALRSAHNPCSKAFLDACDKLGMLVMDEYADMWYIHKNKYDYADYLPDWWKQDLKDMVDKDFNHPSVILYSTGNEVAETGQKRGIALTKDFTEYLHRLDASRPVTCGINIFFNFLYSIGFGVYSDDKAEKAGKDAGEKKKKPVGSEFYNTLAGLFGDYTMKLGATLYPCDLKTRDAYANMDVAGYNYGILRYSHDLKKYPNRLILGSETFCKDTYRFWEQAKKNPRIIGDFVWAGMDYIGEAGIGAWEYEDYLPENANQAGWLTAGSGRINIIGRPNGEAAYTKVAFELADKPAIAVKPVYQKGKHSPSAWKMTDAIESWSWRGCAGDAAEVEVYARAAAVELLVNGKSVGRKKMKNTCNVTFHTQYEDGEITAVAFGADGREMSRTSLQTAGEETKLRLIAETENAAPEGLVFVRLEYTDSQGILKPMEKHFVKLTVENGTLEGFGNACAYNPDGYRKDTVKTYYGEALAAVRAREDGIVKITAQDDDGKRVTVEIPVN